MIGLTGLLTGAAVLYRVNFGVYVAVVVFCDLLVQWWLDNSTRWTSTRLKNILWDLLAYAVPLILFVTAFCLAIYGKHFSSAIYEFTVNTQRLMALRSFNDLESYADLTFSVLLPLGWFSFRLLQGKDEFSAKALIPAILAFAVFGATLAGRTNPSIPVIILALQLGLVIFLHVKVYGLERPELCLLLFFCCLIHYYLSRADWFHWRFLPIIEAMLLVFLLLSRPPGKNEEARSSVSKGTSLAVLLAAFCLLLEAKDFRISAASVRNGVRLLSQGGLPPYLSDTDRLFSSTPPGPAWASVYPDADELQALRYVRSITKGTDAIFVGVKDHSRVFINNLRLYWLAGRPIGARVFQLEPLVASEEGVQRTIISDLENNGVQCLIIDQDPFLGAETFLKSGYVGSTVLDQYISTHFQQQARFGRFAILTRPKS
ncbi:MAG: hypothetical protein ABJF23_27200 [Bryobacteraceae bacterium]